MIINIGLHAGLVNLEIDVIKELLLYQSKNISSCL